MPVHYCSTVIQRLSTWTDTVRLVTLAVTNYLLGIHGRRIRGL